MVQLQEPSVALLQRHFKLEYDSALQLMQSFEGDIVTVPNACLLYTSDAADE